MQVTLGDLNVLRHPRSEQLMSSSKECSFSSSTVHLSPFKGSGIHTQPPVTLSGAPDVTSCLKLCRNLTVVSVVLVARSSCTCSLCRGWRRCSATMHTRLSLCSSCLFRRSQTPFQIVPGRVGHRRLYYERSFVSRPVLHVSPPPQAESAAFLNESFTTVVQ